MPLSVRVRNFQSVEDASIRIEGLTVITGPNNAGKSALMRAIHGAFTNTSGHRFVRHGQKFASVLIEFDDGRRLLWEKGQANHNRYELDGKAFERVGRGAPPEISSLGMKPVEAAGRDLWPQFAPQFSGQVFLLDEAGHVLAEAIADVDKVGVLNEALRLSQSDRRSSASELKVRMEDVSKLESALEKFNGLDAAVSQVRDVEAFQARIRKNQADISAIKRLAERFAVVSQEVSRLRPVRNIGLTDEALTTRVRKLESAIGWAHSTRTRLDVIQKERLKSVQVGRLVQDHPLPDTSRLHKIQKAVGEARGLKGRLQAALDAVGDLRDQVAKLHQASQAAERTVLDIFKEAGNCPFCGAEHEATRC